MRLPWPDLLAHAALQLGWHPADFWRATPQELALLVTAQHEAAGGLSPSDIADLKRKLTHGT